MANDVFPYNLPSRQALIRLIQETHPRFNLKDEYTEFSQLFFAPTETSSGRTFITVEQTDLNITRSYVFRRLNLSVAFRGSVTVKIEGAITSRSIVAELNRSRNMHLGPEDVEIDDTVLNPNGFSVNHTLKAKPGSYVWFGELVVNAESLSRPANVRLLEDGTERLLEDGEYRLLETVA